MKFAPTPENDFALYIATYYAECRRRFPKIEGIAGKWMFRDLTPGMSDFDTRFILNNDMTPDDWCEMSTLIGETHLQFCCKYPNWARNLEHLPGINLTWSELVEERSYYPEFQQWTFYESQHPEKIQSVLEHFLKRPWDSKDDYFHLKKFCLYFGRYNRSIDPAINLGIHENKYPLHSRIMHYFNPPVMSAICLLEKKNIAGKRESFELARDLFPKLPCWDLIDQILDAGYKTPDWYREPRLIEMEDILEDGLKMIARTLANKVPTIPDSTSDDPARWKEALAQIKVDPKLAIIDNTKFVRLMKGRLSFYCRAPNHFDNLWLIRNELDRMGENFFRTPFRTYWKIKTGDKRMDPAQVIDKLEGRLLTKTEAKATREFDRLTRSRTKEGKERETTLAIIDVFDDFFRALSKINETV